MKRSHIAVSAAGAVLLAGSIAAQPLVTMKSLESALATGDEGEIRELVDFARLKENLKHQLRESIEAEAGDSNAASEVVAVLGGALIDQIVTPKQLINFASKQRTAAGSEPSYRYASTSKFTATFPTTHAAPITLVLERDGFSWRLTDIGGVLENFVPVSAEVGIAEASHGYTFADGVAATDDDSPDTSAKSSATISGSSSREHAALQAAMEAVDSGRTGSATASPETDDGVDERPFDEISGSYRAVKSQLVKAGYTQEPGDQSASSFDGDNADCGNAGCRIQWIRKPEEWICVGVSMDEAVAQADMGAVAHAGRCD